MHDYDDDQNGGFEHPAIERARALLAQPIERNSPEVSAAAQRSIDSWRAAQPQPRDTDGLDDVWPQPRTRSTGMDAATQAKWDAWCDSRIKVAVNKATHAIATGIGQEVALIEKEIRATIADAVTSAKADMRSEFGRIRQQIREEVATEMATHITRLEQRIEQLSREPG